MQRRDFLRYTSMSVIGLTLGCGSSEGGPGNSNPASNPGQPILAATTFEGTFRFDARGNRYDINSLTVVIGKFSSSGRQLWLVDRKGLGEQNLDTPISLAVDSAGRVWVLDRGLGRLQVLDSNGKFLRNVGGDFASPQDIVIGDRRVYVSDAIRKQVFVFDLNGNLLTRFGSGLLFPRGLGLDPGGRLHLADGDSVRIFTPEGMEVSRYGAGRFLHALGVAIRSQDGLIVVADAGARQLELFGPDLQSLGQLRLALQPLDVEFGPDGRLYVGGLTQDV